MDGQGVRIALTFQKDLPEVLRQAIPRGLLFGAVRDRAVCQTAGLAIATGRDHGVHQGTRIRPDPADPTCAGYSLAISIGAARDVTPPEICDAIRKAATTAGTLINLRN
jgi:hypothetical protein